MIAGEHGLLLAPGSPRDLLQVLKLAQAVPGTGQVSELLTGQESMYQAMLGRFPENLCPYGVLWPGGRVSGEENPHSYIK